MGTAHAHVRLLSDQRGADGQPAHEILAAEKLGPERYRLIDSPYAVFGCAREDVIRVDADGTFVIEQLGGRINLQVFCELDPGPIERRVVAAVAPLGGTLDNRSRSGGAMAFSVPRAVGHRAVAAAMGAALGAGGGVQWYYASTRPQSGADITLAWAQEFFER